MADTRQLLVRAARDHLDAHGLAGLTLRQIARDAEVSHGAPLRHFAGLAQLLSAVAAEAFDGLDDSVRSHADAAGTEPTARLRAAGRGYVDYAIAHPGPYELMFRPELLDRTDAEYLRASIGAFDTLARLTAAAQGVGWRTDHDHDALVGVLSAGVHGIASLWIQGALPIATGIDTVDPLLAMFQHDLADLAPHDHPHDRSSTMHPTTHTTTYTKGVN